jgi:hypothetical protein
MSEHKGVKNGTKTFHLKATKKKLKKKITERDDTRSIRNKSTVPVA